MSKQHTLSSLTFETREGAGTTSSQALRRAGKVPGVIYGHGAPTNVSIDAKQLSEFLLSGNRSHVVDATIGGASDKVLLRGIAVDPLKRKPLAVDFQRISGDEAISASVAVATSGTPTGVTDQGGVLDVVTHALDVKGPSTRIPDHLTIDVSQLGVHQHVTAGQVTLPDGFTLLTPPDTIVVSVSVTRAEVSSGTDNAEAQPTEAPTAP